MNSPKERFYARIFVDDWRFHVAFAVRNRKPGAVDLSGLRQGGPSSRRKEQNYKAITRMPHKSSPDSVYAIRLQDRKEWVDPVCQLNYAALRFPQVLQVSWLRRNRLP
jgi:hypothetical protein